MCAVVIRGDARQLPLPDDSADLIVTTTPSTNIPLPVQRPMAVTSHIPAAVVSPCTAAPLRRMAPPARKPIPETTDAAMREVSTVTRSSFV